MDAAEKDRLVARLKERFGKGNAPGKNTSIEPVLEQMRHRNTPGFGMHAGETSSEDAFPVNAAQALALLIDHTALKPEATTSDIRVLCQEAMDHGFASVCVNPCYVPLAAELLTGASIKVCTVIGFPLGSTQTATKAYEAELAVREGADEVDMVINVGMLKSENYDYVEHDIRAVVEASKTMRRGPARHAIVKVIIETALLTDREKVIACLLAQNAGAHFVKTSTGFSSSGATPSDVALMRRVVGGRMGVKASGGIRSAEDARTMIEHGATRIGASASVAIVKGLEGAEGGS